MRIAKVDDNLELDLDKVTHITGITGSQRDRRYEVHLDSGKKVVILEDSDGFHPAMDRATLIKKWRGTRESSFPEVPEPPAKRKTNSVY